MDQVCMVCGNVGFNDGEDGFFYCGNCNSQAEGLINACADEDDMCNNLGMYSQRRARHTPAAKLSHSQTIKDDNDVKLGDGLGPSGPADFGWTVDASYETYYSAIRGRYVLGFLIMLQNQSKALVEHFNVSRNILDLHNSIWVRLLASTGVMADDWADKTLHESELQNLGDVTESQRSARHIAEPQNMFGQRAVMIWYRSLRSRLPISYTLALSFLFCHVAEEPILPTDILKGVVEGKIPYLSAFIDVEKQLGAPPPTFPISSTVMFRPIQVMSLQKLEATAACISEKIGLELPPLNFNSLATRYIEELSLSAPKILPLASRIYEWSMPRGIHLSPNELKLPSRVFLMSILIVAVRVCYNINGFGKLESAMSNSSNSFSPNKSSGEEKHTVEFDIGTDAPEEGFIPHISSKDHEVHDSEVVELLRTLDGEFCKLSELHDTFEKYKDLPSYLQFCKDSVFAGVEIENYDEKTMIEDLWQYYLDQKVMDTSPTVTKNPQGEGTISSVKRDMADNKFVYIPPRNNVKRDDHIYYSRKKSNGAYTYAVHGDYYILLRSCAKACQVDIRTLQIGVLTFERLLQERQREQVASTVQ